MLAPRNYDFTGLVMRLQQSYIAQEQGQSSYRCSTIASAQDPVEIKSLETVSLPKRVNEGHRYLKGREKATKPQGTDEDRAITTPQFGQLSALLKLPKFSNLPLIKQLNKVRLHLSEKAGKAYLAYVKRRYERNPNNFM
ncbi:hypothetical protein C6341_g16297 [Phytophthora cactorum]|nr:hypothetical protein C6341_g16297 [Phytophthora cactorum]